MRLIFLSYLFANVLMPVLVAILWKQNRTRFQGLSFWLFACIFQSLGLILFAFRDILPDFLTVLAANLLIIGGIWILYVGLEHFTGKLSGQIPNLFILLILLSVLYYFTYEQKDISIRTMATSVGIFLMTAQCGNLLLRRVNDELKPVTLQAGIIFVLYSFLSLLRVIFLTFNPVPANAGFFQFPLEQTLLVFIYLILAIALALNLNIMVTRRLQSDVQRYEDESTKAEERLQLLKYSIDTAPDGAYWMDEKGHFIYVNNAGCNALGYKREELLQMHVQDVNPRVTPERWSQVWQLLKEKGHFTIESVHRRKDGSEFPVEIISAYIKFGNQEYCNGFARDITERKQAEEKVNKSLVEKETLLRELYHRTKGL